MSDYSIPFYWCPGCGRMFNEGEQCECPETKQKVPEGIMKEVFPDLAMRKRHDNPPLTLEGPTITKRDWYAMHVLGAVAGARPFNWGSGLDAEAEQFQLEQHCRSVAVETGQIIHEWIRLETE